MNEPDAILGIIRQKNQAPIAIAPDRTALLVIDVQRYFVRPEYSFGQVFERLVPGVTSGYFQRVRDTVLPNIRRLQEGFRARGMPIFFTATGTRLGNGRDLPGWLRISINSGLRCSASVCGRGWMTRASRWMTMSRRLAMSRC